MEDEGLTKAQCRGSSLKGYSDFFPCSQRAAAPTPWRAGPDGAEQSLPVEMVGPAALAACQRGLAAGERGPSSWHHWNLASWQLCVTAVVTAVSTALCITSMAKAWTLSAPIHSLTRSSFSPSKVSLSLKELLRTPSSPSRSPSTPQPWSGPVQVLPCVSLGSSGQLLLGRASGPRLPSSHRHSSHHAHHWRNRRSENTSLSESYNPMKQPVREVTTGGRARQKHPSCTGMKNSRAWGSVLQVEQGPGAGHSRAWPPAPPPGRAT